MSFRNAYIDDDNADGSELNANAEAENAYDEGDYALTGAEGDREVVYDECEQHCNVIANGAYGVEETYREDLAAVLEDRERDLQLAAELGKALLERNGELERKTEQLVDEYSRHIEEIEQDRHQLHMKLEGLEGEYDITVKEFQYDVTNLRQQLVSKEQQSRAADKEKKSRIRELVHQNEKLSEELQQVGNRITELEHELQYMKENTLDRSPSIHIEILQEEISTITSRNHDLERQVALISEERESLITCLDEAQDKIKVLERQKHEQETELHSHQQEVCELNQTISQLTEQLEQLTERASNASGQSQTLFSELAQLSGGPSSLAMVIDSPVNPYPPSMFGDDEIECDDDDFLMMPSSSSPIMLTELVSQKEHSQMEEEIVHAYRHLRRLCDDIREQLGDSVDDDLCSEAVSENSGSLEGVVVELRDLLHEAMDKTSQTQLQHVSEVCCLEQRLGDLDRDLQHCQSSLVYLRQQLNTRDAQLQERSNKMMELSEKVTSQQEDMRKLSAERDKLQEMLIDDLKSSDVIKITQMERDIANEKKCRLEKELQQARFDVITLSRRLMDNAMRERASGTQYTCHPQVQIKGPSEEKQQKLVKRRESATGLEFIQTDAKGLAKSQSMSYFPSSEANS